ncbi:hypothetical protein GCM10007907_04660 [Chitinimonas prasina]|uniref:CheW-like domain-containing protein n=1 Tax=Chitinimonas prasina TaxID=1434937 RepID=A0ABQ5Y9Q5_9NEIS|nr:chemotaxis protein CheW [Chitinimonas prasina]GLR11676.1 hypothetical protein GCM10007907_04660 [Chitinimonas prasina]
MGSIHTVLPFNLNGHCFALPAQQVIRVLQALAVLPLPAAPAVISGICQVHGKIIPVMNMRARLGWPPAPPQPWAHWIWLRGSQRELLLPVDRTDPVCQLSSELHPVSALQGSDATIRGVLADGQGLYLLQDVDTFLSQADEQQLGSALAAHAHH